MLACVRALQIFFVCARVCKCGVATRVQQLLCECRLARVSLSSLTKENLTCNCFRNWLSFFITAPFFIERSKRFLANETNSTLISIKKATFMSEDEGEEEFFECYGKWMFKCNLVHPSVSKIACLVRGTRLAVVLKMSYKRNRCLRLQTYMYVFYERIAQENDNTKTMNKHEDRVPTSIYCKC